MCPGRNVDLLNVQIQTSIRETQGQTLRRLLIQNTSGRPLGSVGRVFRCRAASFLEALCYRHRMPAIVLKSVPETLHSRLKRAAAAHRRSLTQEAIVLLEAALAQQEAPAQNSEPYFARRVFLPEFEALQKAGGLSGGPDSTELISEGRDRS